MKILELPKTILDQKSFKCPHCGAFSYMKWDNLSLLVYDDQGAEHNVLTRVHQANCASCNKDSIWYNHREVTGWLALQGIPRPSDNTELLRLFPVQEVNSQDIPDYLPDTPEEVKNYIKRQL